MSTEPSQQMEWILLPLLSDTLPYIFDNVIAFNGFQAQYGHCASAIHQQQFPKAGGFRGDRRGFSGQEPRDVVPR
ncbi:hypothetical protein SAMN04488540_10857 [Ferrimonas sediminum]|uniref:Uncharacterized protein n=1 Tax=Ferrimonas sediminum TaxID=718193 RepID=A0A1G8TR26_9GAMM|nr:hypothetical protein SAMN04488540_10857 [Ferrimonas sediminum]